MTFDPTRGTGNSNYPVGTYDEAKRIQLDTTNVATCSQRSQNNLGCPYYRTCRFRQIRDGQQPQGFKAPLAGPECIAVFRKLSPSEGGEAALLETTCFGYYLSGLHQRWEQMRNTGEVIKILGVAGDGKKYRFRETVRAHVKKDPNCDECMNHKCVKTITREDVREITPFKRPNDRFASHALGAEIFAEAVGEQERETDEAAFAQFVVAPEEGESAKPSGAGAQSRK